jgi:predicted extracellular nuclease
MDKRGLVDKIGLAAWRLFLTIFISVACAQTSFLMENSHATNKKGEREVSSTFSMASYNLLNLFDTRHDEGKNDVDFLPLSYPDKEKLCREVYPVGNRFLSDCLTADWNDQRLELKLNQIKKAMELNFQTLPDVLAVMEVENQNVVGQLAKKLGYKNFVVTNSPDKRGIDVALLYNLKEGVKFSAAREHAINNDPWFTHDKPTRNILEIELSLNEKPLSIFINHWPSQASPSKYRFLAAQFLKNIVDERLNKSPQHHVVVLGDFNTLSADRPHSLYEVLQVGDQSLINVNETFFASSAISQELKKSMPRGTYFYPTKMSWDMLDYFFVSKNLNDGNELEMDLSSFRIPFQGITGKYEYKTKGDFSEGTVITNTPLRYNHNTDDPALAGFSDHFPITLNLVY